MGTNAHLFAPKRTLAHLVENRQRPARPVVTWSWRRFGCFVARSGRSVGWNPPCSWAKGNRPSTVP